MKVNNLLRDIYTDYLLVCPTQITATGQPSFVRKGYLSYTRYQWNCKTSEN